LQRQLLEGALARARALPGAHVTLWIAGPHDDATLGFARDAGVDVREQRGADLGARMAHAFEATLDGRRPMLLIGTDCPAQTVDDLHAALRALDDADAVLQPAEDGGYVLIGMKRPLPVLFEEIDWGTASVLASTRRRAATHGIALAEIAECWDLDRSDDLDRALALGLVRVPDLTC
jgi:rSAM/selenodomain-associated transferase 1